MLVQNHQFLKFHINNINKIMPNYLMRLSLLVNLKIML